MFELQSLWGTQAQAESRAPGGALMEHPGKLWITINKDLVGQLQQTPNSAQNMKEDIEKFVRV